MKADFGIEDVEKLPPPAAGPKPVKKGPPEGVAESLKRLIKARNKEMEQANR